MKEMKSSTGLLNRTNNKTRLVVVLNNEVLDFNHCSTFDISNLHKHSFRLRVLYVMYYIFQSELNWTVLYTLGDSQPIIIDRFTVPSLITRDLRFAALDLVSKVFGRQNLYELFVKVSLRANNTHSKKLNNITKFIGERIHYG